MTTTTVNYRAAFEKAVDTVREEGRYRIFRDIRRKAGEFPRATWFKDDNTEKAVSYTHLTLPTKA